MNWFKIEKKENIFNPIDKANNMNVVRYYLCLCIIMNHFNVLTDAGIPALPRIFGGVGSFFALSGFLMFNSYERHGNLKGYVIRRAKRILPPYIFIVIVAAVFLGMLSTLPLEEYYVNNQVYRYLFYNLIFLNFIEPSLPGVFSDNLMSAVNGSLWTMKGEIICYILVPIIFYLIKLRPKSAMKLLLMLSAISMTAYIYFTIRPFSNHSLSEIIAKQFRVFSFFYIGAILNYYWAVLKENKWLTLVCGLLVYAAAESITDWGFFLRPISDSIMVIWFSMIGKWGAFASRYNSVSYNMYLFHFPIIQTIIAIGLYERVGGIMSLLIAIAITVLLSAFSWFAIDKKILNRKRGQNMYPKLKAISEV